MSLIRKSRSLSLASIRSFFDGNFELTAYAQKTMAEQKSKRAFLKSALGATAIGVTSTAMSTLVNRANANTAVGNNAPVDLNSLLTTDPWQTLNAVLEHLLPASPSDKPSTGPSAVDIQATQYLVNVVYQQPTAEDDITFIYKGVGWLNDFSQSQHQQTFIALPVEKKESLLKKISRSRAGENWINNLINYIYEAMLSAPSYGGNPKGIGWQWLEHHSGYPLPPVGKRYFELPGKNNIAVKNVTASARAAVNQTANSTSNTSISTNTSTNKNANNQNRKKA